MPPWLECTALQVKTDYLNLARDVQLRNSSQAKLPTSLNHWIQKDFKKGSIGIVMDIHRSFAVQFLAKHFFMVLTVWHLRRYSEPVANSTWPPLCPLNSCQERKRPTTSSRMRGRQLTQLLILRSMLIDLLLLQACQFRTTKYDSTISLLMCRVWQAWVHIDHL